MCDCKLCVRNKSVQLAIERLPDDRQQFFSDFFEYVIGVETDLGYYKAIVDGSWPNADEIIKYKRGKK
jgi:hypothetical protein